MRNAECEGKRAKRQAPRVQSAKLKQSMHLEFGWIPMEFVGIREVSLDFDGFRGISRRFVGVQRVSMDFDGLRWVSMAFNGFRFRWVSMDSRGFRCMLMDFGGFRWILLDFGGMRGILIGLIGFPWVSLGFDRFRWISMESAGPRWLPMPFDFRSIRARLRMPECTWGHLGAPASTEARLKACKRRNDHAIVASASVRRRRGASGDFYWRETGPESA